VKSRIEKDPLIGIIGGVGPYAGLDFVRKIFANTKAVKDQDHINCLLISCPSVIPDRTEFLLSGNDEANENPAFGMFDSAQCLYKAGVLYTAVACNTAHSEKIFSPFLDMVKEKLPGLKVINMLETSASYIKELYPKIKKVGLLATKGTYNSKVYHEYFNKKDGFELIEPEESGRERVHDAIYSEDYGIKANSIDIKQKARDLLDNEINALISRGAEAVILGCTELPLAVTPQNYNILIIDPGLITVRKLILLSYPDKLLIE